MDLTLHPDQDGVFVSSKRLTQCTLSWREAVRRVVESTGSVFLCSNPPFSSWLSRDKLLRYFEPLFPHLEHRDNNTICKDSTSEDIQC